jgi:hypothetical protein
MELNSEQIEKLKSKWKFDEAAQRYAAALRGDPPTLEEIRRDLDPGVVELYIQLRGKKETGK